MKVSLPLLSKLKDSIPTKDTDNDDSSTATAKQGKNPDKKQEQNKEITILFEMLNKHDGPKNQINHHE